MELQRRETLEFYKEGCNLDMMEMDLMHPSPKNFSLENKKGSKSIREVATSKFAKRR